MVYLFVTPFFPTPDSWRGAYGYDFVRALSKALSKGDRVLVFKPGDGTDYALGDVTVHTFRERRLPSGVLPLLFRRANERSFLRKLASVLKTISEESGSVACRRDSVSRLNEDFSDLSVCHANTADCAIYPLAVKRLNPACRTILQHHDLQSFGLNGGRLKHCWLHNMILFPQLRRLYEALDLHVFISAASERSFRAAPDASWTTYADYTRQMRGLPYRPAQIKASKILHNGVNTDLFAPSLGTVPTNLLGTVPANLQGTGPTELGTDPMGLGTVPMRIGCVGNFEVLKDQVSLIRAVGRLDFPVRVTFIGSGPQLDLCRAEAARVTAAHPTATFEFRTEVRHEQLPAFYRELDLFVLPSFFEGFGCVYTEAWSCGVPFIACEGQGIEDMIAPEERSLWLAKPQDPDDLAAKITSFHDRRPAQHLTGEVSIDSLVATFVDEAMAKPRRRDSLSRQNMDGCHRCPPPPNLST